MLQERAHDIARKSLNRLKENGNAYLTYVFSIDNMKYGIWCMRTSYHTMMDPDRVEVGYCHAVHAFSQSHVFLELMRKCGSAPKSDKELDSLSIWVKSMRVILNPA
jgi:hypothetical protein